MLNKDSSPRSKKIERSSSSKIVVYNARIETVKGLCAAVASTRNDFFLSSSLAVPATFEFKDRVQFKTT